MIPAALPAIVLTATYVARQGPKKARNAPENEAVDCSLEIRRKASNLGVKVELLWQYWLRTAEHTSMVLQSDDTQLVRDPALQ